MLRMSIELALTIEEEGEGNYAEVAAGWNHAREMYSIGHQCCSFIIWGELCAGGARHLEKLKMQILDDGLLRFQSEYGYLCPQLGELLRSAACHGSLSLVFGMDEDDGLTLCERFS